MRKLLLATAIAGFGFASTPVLAQEEAPNANTVLAVVDGQVITLGQVIMLRTQLPEQYLSAPDDILFKGILNQLIDQTLLAEYLERDTPEIRISLENEARSLRAAAVISDVIKENVTEDMIQAAYDKIVADLPEEPEYNASHILVKTEDEAKELVKELENGADFAELAKEKSTGPSGPNGGELGWFGKGMMVPEFETAVTSLEVGQISAPVQTQFGWHVVKLNDKRIKPAPTLDELRDQITQQLQAKVLDERIAEIRDGATIEDMSDGIDPALIKDYDLIKNAEY